jgi:hypothetical protein
LFVPFGGDVLQGEACEGEHRDPKCLQRVSGFGLRVEGLGLIIWGLGVRG